MSRIIHGVKFITSAKTSYVISYCGKRSGQERKEIKAIKEICTVFTIPRENERNLHPTKKPDALFAQLILNSTSRDAVVYDPFSGGGTTLSACEATGRTAYVMEYDPLYASRSLKRMEARYGLTPKLIR